MAVNFAHEYKKFEEQQARLYKEYKAARNERGANNCDV